MSGSFIAIFILIIVSEIIYFRLANHFNIIDRPNERSSHKHITLRGGGVVFLFSIWLYSFFFGFQYPWFLAGLTLVAIVSFIDDIRSLSDSVRLIVQFVSMFLVFYEFGILNWQSWWIVLIALIACVGITNVYNFMDGINGITGGYSLAILLPLIYVNSMDSFVDPNLLYVVGLSLLVFCFFNFRKRAKCFAGDVGSLSMAFIVVFLLGMLILKSGDFTYIIFLALYGVDAVLTICHRILLRENLGQAHRKHAYQLLANELKIPHVVVSLLYMVIQLIVSFGLIFTSVNHWFYLICVLVILSISYLIFMKRYYHLHAEYLKSKQA